MAKKDYIKLRRMAYEMVVEQAKTQREVSELIGMSEKTLSVWANEDDWKRLRKVRQSAASTARQNIHRIISLLSEKRLEVELQISQMMDDGNKEEEVVLRKEANQLSNDMIYQNKMLVDLDEKKTITLGVYVDVFDSIFSSLRAYDPKLFDQTIEFQTFHIRVKSNDLG